MTVELLYGFDALCGWCYGGIPAMRRVLDDHPALPVRLVLPGLVTGDRAGPYAQMEAYIRGASERLQAVTGRAPSAAFYDLIRTPGVRGDSGPPTAAIAQVQEAAPDRAIAFAHAVCEAHFAQGADLNRAETYIAIHRAMALNLPPPPLDEDALIAAVWARGRATGIASFPSFLLQSAHRIVPLRLSYDPAALSDAVGRAVAAA